MVSPRICCIGKQRGVSILPGWMSGIISITMSLQLHVAPVRWRIEFKGFRCRTLHTKTENIKISGLSMGFLPLLMCSHPHILHIYRTQFGEWLINRHNRAWMPWVCPMSDFRFARRAAVKKDWFKLQTLAAHDSYREVAWVFRKCSEWLLPAYSVEKPEIRAWSTNFSAIRLAS